MMRFAAFIIRRAEWRHGRSRDETKYSRWSLCYWIKLERATFIVKGLLSAKLCQFALVCRQVLSETININYLNNLWFYLCHNKLINATCPSPACENKHINVIVNRDTFIMIHMGWTFTTEADMTVARFPGALSCLVVSEAIVIAIQVDLS